MGLTTPHDALGTFETAIRRASAPPPVRDAEVRAPHRRPPARQRFAPVFNAARRSL